MTCLQTKQSNYVPFSFVRDVASVSATQLGVEERDEEVGPLLQGPPLSRDSTSYGKLPHPLHLCTPLTLFPTPLYASLHTFLHMLSWPRLPLDEDVTCDT